MIYNQPEIISSILVGVFLINHILPVKSPCGFYLDNLIGIRQPEIRYRYPEFLSLCIKILNPESFCNIVDFRLIKLFCEIKLIRGSQIHILSIPCSMPVMFIRI